MRAVCEAWKALDWRKLKQEEGSNVLSLEKHPFSIPLGMFPR